MNNPKSPHAPTSVISGTKTESNQPLQMMANNPDLFDGTPQHTMRKSVPGSSSGLKQLIHAKADDRNHNQTHQAHKGGSGAANRQSQSQNNNSAANVPSKFGKHDKTHSLSHS
jgi:hypothetical protein